MRRSVLTVFVAASLAFAPTPVSASYPGENGKLALERCGNDGCDVWVTNADGTGLRRLISNARSPSWSPAGDKIAFSRVVHGQSEIFIAGAAGGSITRITKSSVDDRHPTWSPTGDAIAFQRADATTSTIFIKNLPDGSPTEVAGTDGGRTPAWSPQGDVIAFVAAPPAQEPEVWSVPATGGVATNLTTNPLADRNPTWSPNGEALAFERVDLAGDVDLHAVDADGSNPIQLTASDSEDIEPAWAPDRSDVAFIRKEAGGAVVRTVAASGGSGRLLKDVAADDLDWQPCPATGCPGGRVPLVHTALRLDVAKTRRRVVVRGALDPALNDRKVEVTLLKKRDGSFESLATHIKRTDRRGRIETLFVRPSKGTCRVKLRYAGDADHLATSARETFPCWLPVRLVAYSPEQLPSNTEHALESLSGVDATTLWSGTKFMKKSRVPGGRVVDDPGGSYTIPLDAAFVEPREFARFAKASDRDRIRALRGSRALFAQAEAGLRGGHEKLKMRFTVGRGRSVGTISNESAQGYEIVMAKPVAHASVAFRVALIEKSPSVSRRSIREVLRRVLGPNKHLELSSEKQVPYLRHAQLVRSQLFIKKAFGEFAMHPTTGRSIAIKPPWTGNNVRTWSVPVLGRVTCHKKLFPQLRGAMRELKNKGLAGLATRGSYAGCFNPRFISSYTGSDVGPVKRLSRHAWGVALDINANLNPFGATPHQDPRLVRIMRKWGFTWGGRWALPDGMHFEWERFPK